MTDTKEIIENAKKIAEAMKKFSETSDKLKEFRRAVEHMDSEERTSVTETMFVCPTTEACNSSQGSSNRDLLYNARLRIPADVIEKLIRDQHAELEQEVKELAPIVEVFTMALKNR